MLFEEWQGQTRVPFADQRVCPALGAQLTTWVGVGGSPEGIGGTRVFPMVRNILTKAAAA